MQVLDFYRSFTVFETDFDKKPPRTVSDRRQNRHNRARVRIDCRLAITGPDRKTQEFFLGESNKSERVGASRELGIFTQPNADYRPIHGEEDSILLKSWDKNEKGVMLDPPSLGPQPERNVIKTKEAYYKHCFQLAYQEAALLQGAGQIIAAANAGKALIARTEYSAEPYRVLLEYPIGTMNVSERYGSYQTDTGPVIYPDFSKPFKRLVETFWLAFSSFNSPDWVEFIVEKPTPVGNGISVNHYSEPVWIDHCINSILSVD